MRIQGSDNYIEVRMVLTFEGRKTAVIGMRQL